MKFIGNLALCLMAAFQVGAAQAAEDDVLVGQTAGFTGGQASVSNDLKLGVEAYFKHVNSRGGINGRQLRLVSLDDGGKPDKVLANTRQLVEQD